MNAIGLALGVFVFTVCGVTSSILVRRGVIPVWASLPFTLGTACLWAWQTKYGRLPLLQASAIFDVVATSTWFLGFAIFDKTPLTTVQVIGLLTIVVGMAALNLGGK